MSDPPELDDLARRYLDLWQDQLAGLAADDEVAEVMARTLELMTTGAAALAHNPRADADDRACPEDGTQTASPARGGADPDLAELAGPRWGPGGTDRCPGGRNWPPPPQA